MKTTTVRLDAGTAARLQRVLTRFPYASQSAVISRGVTLALDELERLLKPVRKKVKKPLPASEEKSETDVETE